MLVIMVIRTAVDISYVSAISKWIQHIELSVDFIFDKLFCAC